MKPETTHLLSLSEAVEIRQPCVYALCDSKGFAFYVGKSLRPHRRFREHFWLTRQKNLALRDKIAEVGKGLKIAILSLPVPQDLSLVEQESIKQRPWLLNLIGSEHWSWARQKNKPWMAGTGIWSPTTLVISRMRNQKWKREVQDFLKDLSPVERCCFEIETYRTLPFFHQRRCNRWLNIVKDRMLACMEQSLVGAER